MTTRHWLVLLTICLATVAVSAQRGRGGGRGGDQLPASGTFDSREYALAFSAPPGFLLYTREQPGRYRELFAQRHIAFLVNPMQTGETIGVRFSGNLTEADVKGYRDAMDSAPPQAKMPAYEKVSLSTVKVGRDDSKDAVEYVYKARQEQNDVAVRQVVFVHNGRGFMVTCTAEQKRFEQANKDFSKFLSTIEFK